MSARVVWVRAAIASMLAPLKPRAANSSMAAATMRGAVRLRRLGLAHRRIARLRARARPLELTTLQGKFNRLVRFQATPMALPSNELPEPSNPWASTASSSSSTPPRSRRPSARCCRRWASAPVARHRSREVMLYRQGGMNLIVNSQPPAGSAVDKTPPSPPSRCACATPASPSSARSTSAPGRCRRAPRPWSSTSPASTASATASSTSSTATATSRSTTSISSSSERRSAAAGARRPALVRRGAGHPRRPHGRLARLLPQTSSASRCCRAASISACCPRARCSRAPATSSTCSSSSRRRAPRRRTGTRKAWCAWAWARPTCRPRCARCRSAASCSSTAARCSRATRARSPRCTSAA